jgi:hypothetical protein
MEPEVARRLWRRIEPYHAVVYFASERKERYDALGLKGGWMGYFASRSAAMGPVPPEVVIATFYNFNPGMVRRAIPDAWNYSSPEAVLAARYAIVDSVLRRLLDREIHGDDVKIASELARRAAEASPMDGRPLFAAHAGLEWPSDAHLALWHATTLLREFRGDGHVIALVAHQIGGLEAHVLSAAAGATPAEMLREFRRWSEDDWSAAEDGLRSRGLLDASGALTTDGKRLHTDIEAMTDRLAMPSFEALGPDDTAELERRLSPLVALIHRGAGIDYPNPIGLGAPDSG